MSLVLSGVTNVIEACLSGSCQAHGLRTPFPTTEFILIALDIQCF